MLAIGLNKESLQETKKVINNMLGSVDYLINGAGGNSPLAASGVDQMVNSDLKKSGRNILRNENGRFQSRF